MEHKINKKDGVTKGLMDIYAMDLIEEEQTNILVDEEFSPTLYSGEDNNINDDNYDDEM